MNKKELQQIYRPLLQFYKKHEDIPPEVFATTAHVTSEEAVSLLASLKDTIPPPKKRKYKKRRAKPVRDPLAPPPAPKPTTKPATKKGFQFSAAMSNATRIISNITIIILNAFLTIFLFVNFGSVPWLKVVWACFGTVIMFMQIFSLKRFKGSVGVKQRLGFLIPYICCTFFSVAANVTFTLSEIEHGRQVQNVVVATIEDTQEDVVYYKDKIDGFNKEIDGLREENQLEKTPAWKRSENNVTMKRLLAEVEKAETEWQTAKGQKKEAIKVDKDTIQTKNGLDFTAEALRFIPFFSTLTGEQLKNFLMMLLSFVFEYFLYFTTAGLKEEEE